MIQFNNHTQDSKKVVVYQHGKYNVYRVFAHQRVEFPVCKGEVVLRVYTPFSLRNWLSACLSLFNGIPVTLSDYLTYDSITFTHDKAVSVVMYDKQKCNVDQLSNAKLETQYNNTLGRMTVFSVISVCALILWLFLRNSV